MSKAHKDKIFSVETINKLSNARLDLSLFQETKRKINESLCGKIERIDLQEIKEKVKQAKFIYLSENKIQENLGVT